MRRLAPAGTTVTSSPAFRSRTATSSIFHLRAVPVASRGAAAAAEVNSPPAASPHAAVDQLGVAVVVDQVDERRASARRSGGARCPRACAPCRSPIG